MICSGEGSKALASFKTNNCYTQFAYNFGDNIYLFTFNPSDATINYQNSQSLSQNYGMEFQGNRF